jgi:hypothetical protein
VNLTPLLSLPPYCPTEQQMKRIALGRKNYLFVGNERGGQTAAILSSFTSSCKRHDIDPQRYLTQLLTNLPATPTSQLDQWLPDMWKRRQNPPSLPTTPPAHSSRPALGRQMQPYFNSTVTLSSLAVNVNGALYFWLTEAPVSDR